MPSVKPGNYQSLSVQDFKLDVNIKLLENNKYDLSYSWYENGKPADYKNVEARIFDNTDDVSTNYEGEIIMANQMIDVMISHLVMPDDELQKYTGLGTASDYRWRIVNSLKLFWD
tara:strand:+ start:641 stop:985 length:345 start_codon:yes stop_codon:yes gene_type:complete